MNLSVDTFTANQEYLILLALVMGLSFAAKRTQVFLPIYAFIARHVRSKRAVVALISLVSGVLPINGRASVSAGALDTIAPSSPAKRKSKEMYGVIDYLSTHHYYFWSPLEATVIVPMAALGLTYWQFMGRMWPLLVTAIVVILFYIFGVLKETDIEISIQKQKSKPSVDEDKAQIIGYAKTLVFVAVIIVLGNFAKANFDAINEFVESARNHGLLILVAVAGFLASFALGSSGKFAGFTSLSASVFGVEYLPMFFAIDYAGYMLSPAHKCLAITKSYFGTKLSAHYKAILSLVIPVVAVGILMFLTAA